MNDHEDQSSFNNGTQNHWVLLRGLARESGHWPPDFLRQLEQAFPHSKIHLVDLPGMGDQGDKAPPNDLDSILAIVRKEVHERVAGSLKISTPEERPKINLLALSLGAMVGISWILAYPQEIQSAVLVNTSAGGTVPFFRRLQPRAILHLISALFISSPLEREKQILALVSNRVANREKLVPIWAQLATARPLRARVVVNQLLAAARFRPPLTMPPVPTLLIVGEGDRLVDPQCSETLHRRFGWDIVRHPWAGHDLPIDDGPWVVEEIAAWSRRFALNSKLKRGRSSN